MNNFSSVDLNYLDSVSVIWTSCLVAWTPLLDFACRWPLLSVTYARNMFGNAVASCIVSFDAQNVFEVREALTDLHGDCYDVKNKATDSSAKT